MSKNEIDLAIIDVNSLQNHALEKHELYVNNTAVLHQLEQEMVVLCKEIKKKKAENLHKHCHIEKTGKQVAELRRMIENEETTTSIIEKQRIKLESEIAATKKNYCDELRKHELQMAESAFRFSVAPHTYALKKMKAVSDDFGVKRLDLVNKTQKSMTAETDNLSAELAKMKLETQGVGKIMKILPKASFENCSSSLRNHRANMMSDIEAQEKLKSDLEEKLKRIEDAD